MESDDGDISEDLDSLIYIFDMFLDEEEEKEVV